MMDGKKLKGLLYKLITVMFNASALISFCSDTFAATLQIGMQSVVVMAGQTIEIPLYSTKPMAGDLSAQGNFVPGDVTFTPSPNCHLSSHGCKLLISATHGSKNYSSVPVVVSESGASNKPVFVLSVIRAGESYPVSTKLPEIISKPLMLVDEVNSVMTFAFTNTSKSKQQNIQVEQLPAGVSSSSCATVEPGATCNLRLVVHDRIEPGNNVISIKSDHGILQHRVLSITAPKRVMKKSEEILSSKPIATLTAGNLSATIIAHSLSTTFYTNSSNGPVYQMIEVTNNGSAVTLDTPTISGTDAAFFSIDTAIADYAGSIFCNNAPTLGTGDSCQIIIKSTLGDPASTPLTALLTISDGVAGDTLEFILTDTTYVYAGGGFNSLGRANVSGGSLLVECTAGSCTNALQGTTGNNYAYTNYSVGQWINALSVTPTGNLMVGGAFGGIGGATSGASSGTAALLAQCIPGASVEGNACFNQITSTNPYVFNYAYIDAITSPFRMSTNSDYIAFGGDFSQVKTSSASSNGRLLARCLYNGVAAVATCNTYLGSGTSVNKFANNAITALSTLGSTFSTPLLSVGGLFTQIVGYPSSVPSGGTTFARCTSGSASVCSQGMGTNNPNGSILGISDDGTTVLYMGGTFTQIGGYNDTNSGYPLVRCSPASVTSCDNALAGVNNADGYIEGITYSGGNLYVGGNFTTIGGATSVSSGKMLAVCTPGGGCSNFVTDPNPYATGPDWSGGIFAIAVGNQTTITVQ